MLPLALSAGGQACGAPPPTDDAPATPTGDPATENGLYELASCPGGDSHGGDAGSALVYPRRALPALVLPGQPLVLRVRQARSILPAPGVQRGRALWGWSVRLDAREALALGSAPAPATAPATAPTPALRYPLRVTDVRAEDAGSLVYRVRVEVPRWVLPATYDLTVRRPGASLVERSAVRVLVPGEPERVVQGGPLERPELRAQAAAWGRSGVDLVIAQAEGTSVEHVVMRLDALADVAVPIMVLPPSDRAAPAGWARLVAPPSFAYAIGGVVHGLGRCADGRSDPIAREARAGQAARARWRTLLRPFGELGRDGPEDAGDGAALRGGPVGSLRSAAPGRTAGMRIVAVERQPEARLAADGRGALEVPSGEAAVRVVIALRRGDRLACAAPDACRTIAVAPSPDPFTAPVDAAVGLVVEVVAGSRATLRAVPAATASLGVVPATLTADAGSAFELEARPRGFRPARTLWHLDAPPSADWALDEQPLTEGTRLRHRIRAPGTHVLRAAALAADGTLARASASVEVVPAARSGCSVAGAGLGAARNGRERERPADSDPALLLGVLALCFIRARRNGPGRRHVQGVVARERRGAGCGSDDGNQRA